MLDGSRTAIRTGFGVVVPAGGFCRFPFLACPRSGAASADARSSGSPRGNRTELTATYETLRTLHSALVVEADQGSPIRSLCNIVERGLGKCRTWRSVITDATAVGISPVAGVMTSPSHNMQHRIQCARPCARRGKRPDNPRGSRETDEGPADEAPAETARVIGGAPKSRGGCRFFPSPRGSAAS